jgi:hypothetical protein
VARKDSEAERDRYSQTGKVSVAAELATVEAVVANSTKQQHAASQQPAIVVH